MASSSGFDHDQVLAFKFPETTITYNERDAALYALGVGACGRDPVDADELKYVYHENGQRFIQILWVMVCWPYFTDALKAAIWHRNCGCVGLANIFDPFLLGIIGTYRRLPGLQYDPRLLLHGQQYIEIYKPLPSSASLCNKVSLAGLHDKGKAAIVEVETRTYEKESGQLLCMNRATIFLRGAGGFSNSSQPYSYSTYPANQTAAVKIPKGQPFAVFEDVTQPSQALLYRLSGDYNPLHSDPKIAEVAGFSRPILHGLGTLGFAIRAIIKCICKGDAHMVKNISARFLLHVYPGETLITEMWLDDLRVIYKSKVKERNRIVLSGFVDIRRISSSL